MLIKLLSIVYSTN